MRLEDEIIQEAFRNEHHRLAVNLLFTHGWLVLRYEHELRSYGITLAQYNILRILRGRSPLPATVTVLKERMLDKMSDASRLVDRLEKKALVLRSPSPEDRRRIDVSITPKGLALLAELGAIECRLDESLSAIDEVDARTANEILDRLRG